MAIVWEILAGLIDYDAKSGVGAGSDAISRADVSVAIAALLGVDAGAVAGGVADDMDVWDVSDDDVDVYGDGDDGEDGDNDDDEDDCDGVDADTSLFSVCLPSS